MRRTPIAFSAICRPGAPSVKPISRPKRGARTNDPPAHGSTSTSRASQSSPTPNLRTLVPRVSALRSSLANSGASWFSTATPPGSSPVNISAFASAIASTEPNNSIWIGVD